MPVFFFDAEELLLFFGCPDADEVCAGATLTCNNKADMTGAIKRATNIVGDKCNPTSSAVAEGS